MGKIYKGLNTTCSMKLKDFITVFKNDLTKQVFFNIRKRELKKYGLNIDKLLELEIVVKKKKWIKKKEKNIIKRTKLRY